MYSPYDLVQICATGRQQRCSTMGSACIPCQRCNRAHVGEFLTLEPDSVTYIYILLVPNSFNHFPKNITAATVAQTLVSHWRWFIGVPATILTYRGTQFKSILLIGIARSLGTRRLWTSAYHPLVNERVERMQRNLKTSFKAQTDPHNWAHYLPLVLLSIRTMIKEDYGSFPANSSGNPATGARRFHLP